MYRSIEFNTADTVNTMKNNAGFTLVELLVVIVILVTVGGVIGSTIGSSLRNAGKTSTLTDAQQNGSYAISQISKTIRDSKQWDANDGVSAQTDVGLDGNGIPVITPVPCYPSSSTQYHYIRVTSASTLSTTTFSCDTHAPSGAPMLGANGQSLIDTNVVSVFPDSCYISCSQTTLSSPPVVGIQFQLQQASTSTFVEKIIAPILFQTTVSVRSY